MSLNNDLGIDALDSYLDELGDDPFQADPTELATARSNWRAGLHDMPDEGIGDLEDCSL